MSNEKNRIDKPVNITRRMALKLGGRTAIAMGISARFSPAYAAPKSYDLKPIPVGDGISMIEGATEYFTGENGGAIVNCTLVETPAGIVIVDTGSSRRYGEALREAVSNTTGLPVAAVINTHHHPDHFFGNQVFKDVPIFALGQTAELARTEGDAFSDNMYRLLGDWMRGTEVTPPDKVIETGVLNIGGRKLRAIPLSGHTSSDLVLLDEKTGYAIAGDIAFLDRAPTTPHANLEDWRKSLAEIQSLAPAAIIPGHGPVDRDGRSLVQTRSYLDWLETTLNAAASEGLDMVEIMETRIPAQFAGMGAMPGEFIRSVSHLYPGIERSVLPLVNR
jgi:quinoprotein relay system zinc metallohydrolase 1